MDSTDRFLLGGVLGAALGYLLSQKSVQKALRDVRLPSARREPVIPSTSPLVPAEALVAETSVVEAPVVEAPRMPEVPRMPEWEPIPRPTPAYSPVETPVVEAEAPVLETPAVEIPEAETPSLEAPEETAVPEAIEVEGERFCLGVQWHPEYTWEFISTDFKLWCAFVQAARGER